MCAASASERLPREHQPARGIEQQPERVLEQQPAVQRPAQVEQRPSHAARLARLVLTAPIVVYQRVVSPALPQRCKYYPTCSRYAVEAIRAYGLGRGTVLAVWRVLRCNPWSDGGYDPVEAQRLFGVRTHGG